MENGKSKLALVESYFELLDTNKALKLLAKDEKQLKAIDNIISKIVKELDSIEIGMLMRADAEWKKYGKT